nr:putative GPI-anchored protein pfl2 isoform X2 [Crassostrea gigas]
MSGRVNNKEYDCLMIYNHARSRLSRVDDNELSLRIVERADQQLTAWGYRNNHYYDRDSIPGRNVFTELFRVVDSSQFVLLILTRGFLNNCWIRYCQMAAFKSLIDESTRPECVASHRLIPILINISENEIPQELGQLQHICFMNDWDTNEREWRKLKNALDGHPMQESTQRSIGADIPPVTRQHFSQGISESPNTPAVPSDTGASPISNAPSSRSARTAIVTPNSSGNYNAQSDQGRLSSEDSMDSMNSLSSSLLFSRPSLSTSTNASSTGSSAAQHVPLMQQSNQNQNSIPHRQSEDLVTLSGHGSLSGEQPYEPVARSIRTRLSETNRPVTHTSSVQGDTSIDGSSSISHSFTGDEDITIPKETASTVTPGTLRLQSTVETDAPQPMTSTTAATVQQSVTSPQNHSFTPSLSQSTSDSGIGLMSPELGSLNVASFLPGEAPESLYPSNQIDNSVTLQDKPDSAVNQSPEGPKTCTEDGERPSFFFRAIHFSLHAFFQPDKVYAPP